MRTEAMIMGAVFGALVGAALLIVLTPLLIPYLPDMVGSIRTAMGGGEAMHGDAVLGVLLGALAGAVLGWRCCAKPAEAKK